MKRFLSLVLCSILCFTATACSNQNDDKAETASEVVVNLPADDTVNGYRVESKTSDTQSSMPNTISGSGVSVGSINTNTDNTSKDYCGNKNSKVFHKSSCSSVSSMKDENKYYADRETLLNEGYKACGKCNP